MHPCYQWIVPLVPPASGLAGELKLIHTHRCPLTYLHIHSSYTTLLRREAASAARAPAWWRDVETGVSEQWRWCRCREAGATASTARAPAWRRGGERSRWCLRREAGAVASTARAPAWRRCAGGAPGSWSQRRWWWREWAGAPASTARAPMAWLRDLGTWPVAGLWRRTWSLRR